jgi:hypothetical protein
MEDMEREDKLNEQTKPVAIKPICLCGDDEVSGCTLNS